MKKVKQSFSLFANLLICILFVAMPSVAQNKVILTGSVTDAESGEPLPGADILVAGERTGTASDYKGAFKLSLPPGKHRIEVSFSGYEKQVIEQKFTQSSYRFDLSLKPIQTTLNNVTVVAKSRGQKMREMPSSLAVVEAKELKGRTLTTEEVLNKTIGVKVNKNGGLGSRSRIIVQGMDGKRVGVFVNGIPVGNSESLQAMPIPTDNIERIEVYKGTVPVWLGGDGIGGAVNIILKERLQNHIDLSYEAGSFCTHRGFLSGGYMFPNTGMRISVNGTADYSKNNYSFLSPFQEGLVVKRTHDVFRNLTGDIGVEFTKLWFDNLALNVGYTNIYDEVQGGLMTIQKPVHHAHTHTNSLVGSISLRKRLLADRLDMSFMGMIGQGTFNLVDTSRYCYNYDGSRYPSPHGKGEIGLEPHDSNDKMLKVTTLLRTTYSFNDAFSVSLNSSARYDRKRPSDPLADSYLKYPVSGYPSNVTAVITGLSYQYSFLSNALVNEGGVKHFFFHSKVLPRTFTAFQIEPELTENKSHSVGWSEALSWKPAENATIKASCQRMLRIPTADELFGDAVMILPADKLLPEKSFNINLGTDVLINSNNYPNFRFDVNAYYMYLSNMIHMDMTGGMQMRHVNIGKARTFGVEAEVKSDLAGWCTLSANGAYIDTRDRTEKALGGGDNFHYNYRLPNIPYFFANAEANVHFSDLWIRHTYLSLFSSIEYTEQFSYDWEASKRNSMVIPRKWNWNAGLYFSYANRYHFTFEAHNLLNKEHWAEFQYPLPGRSFHLKFMITLI